MIRAVKQIPNGAGPCFAWTHWADTIQFYRRCQTKVKLSASDGRGVAPEMDGRRTQGDFDLPQLFPTGEQGNTGVLLVKDGELFRGLLASMAGSYMIAHGVKKIGSPHNIEFLGRLNKG